MLRESSMDVDAISKSRKMAPSSMQVRDRLGSIPLKPIATDAIASVGSVSYDIGTGGPIDGHGTGWASSDVVVNWMHELVCCGSNATNQLSADLSDLMIPRLQHVPHHRTIIDNNINSSSSSSSSNREILQLCCNGNQTAVLIGEEKNEGEGGRHDSREVSSTNDSLEQLLSKRFNYELYLWGAGKSSPQMKTPVSIPLKVAISKLACGQTHAGFLTQTGAVFTWGSGDYGMLGHGTRNAVSTPKRVDSMKSLVCTDLSCGAFHSAFIAAPKAEVSYVRLPPPRNSTTDQRVVGYAGASILSEEGCAAAGDLYMCGLGKGGQLGLDVQLGQLPHSGPNAGLAMRPSLVPFFESISHKAIRVSCGFHHTLVITVPSQSHRVFSPCLYAFGYGEHGRLGIGSEEQVCTPMQVLFQTPFHPTQVSAGEQHSVALGKEGCYSWGSNDRGQLGVGSPRDIPYAVLPQKIPLPEGMVLRRLVAGGHHTAGITYGGAVLSWGWGEEGQLGHGGEKSACLPKPCKLPSLFGRLSGVPMDISLGSTHTFIALHNPHHQYRHHHHHHDKAVAESVPMISISIEEEELVSPEDVVSRGADNDDDVLMPEDEVVPLISTPVLAKASMSKPPSIAGEDEDCDEDSSQCQQPFPSPPPVRSLKDILQQRAEREREREGERSCVVQATAAAVSESYAADPMDQDEGSLSLAALPLIATSSESCSTDSASLSEEVMVAAAPSQDSTEQLQQLEYAFDAIPFQHSRKRAEIRKANSSQK